MNTKTFFMNNGHFDVASMLTFGVSVKENENAIGYFGTGFKYAVAIILRAGGTVKVYTKKNNEIEVYEFDKQTRNIQGKDFDMVTCNGNECGFTTRMGITWENWMAYRELRCNATDEGGEISIRGNDAYDTVVEVDCREIADAHSNADMHFVSGNLIGKFAGVEVYERPSMYIYYQGVAVLETQQPSKYSYNIVDRSIELTEDRTAKCDYSIRFLITQCMQQSDNETFIDNVLEQDKSYEAAAGFDTHWVASETFIKQAIKKDASGKGISENAKKIVQSHIDRNGSWNNFELTHIQHEQYEKACVFLKTIDVDISDYPVEFVVGLGCNVMGRAHKGTIYLSEIPFNQGTKQVASTLLEEWVHLKTGAADFDRTMQSWLFDKILSLGEASRGAAL
jgi:hypothetical protein